MNPLPGPRPAVFLDRDGVLNDAIVRNGRPYPPSRIDEFVLLPGVVDACVVLRSSGFALVVVTNQPDIARGSQDQGTMAAMHEILRTQLVLDGIYVCPHDDDAHCRCRKPSPGMLETASEDLNLILAESFMIGDRWRDIEAGRRAGCRTIHIDRHYEERAPQEPDLVVPDLRSALPWIQAFRASTRESHIA